MIEDKYESFEPLSRHSVYGDEVLRTPWGSWYWSLEKDPYHVFYVLKGARKAVEMIYVRPHDRTPERAMRRAAKYEYAKVARNSPARPKQAEKNKQN